MDNNRVIVNGCIAPTIIIVFSLGSSTPSKAGEVMRVIVIIIAKKIDNIQIFRLFSSRVAWLEASTATTSSNRNHVALI